MRFWGTVGSGWIRWAGLMAALGGVLWIPYGIFEMLQPWGTDTVYRDDVGYEVITNVPLYRLYSLPGSLALLLTSQGLLGTLALLRLPAGRPGKVGYILTYLAVVLAVTSLGGVIVLFDPVFTACRIFGTLALGIATVLVAADAQQAGRAPGWGIALLLLGLVGMFLFPLWPLVHAMQWLSEGAGAGVIALYGLGWLATGYRLYSTTD